MNRSFGITAVLLLLGVVAGVCQELPDELALVPLIDEAGQDQEKNAQRFLWKKEAADNALRSGLASIAVGLYDDLLNGIAPHDTRKPELELSRISAFIALGKLEEADAALTRYSEFQDSQFNLRRALVSFFNGDRSVAERMADRVVEAELLANELPWYLMLRGLLNLKSQNENDEESFLNRARTSANSLEQRAQIDLLIYRALLLEHEGLDQGDLNRLKADSELEIRQGKRVGFQFAKEYAIGLFLLDRADEAVLAIEETIPRIKEADYDLRDELLLLEGIISERETSAGRDAFRKLLSIGVSTDLRLRALQELVASASSAEDIQSFLQFTGELDQETLPEKLVNQILYNRGQLLYWFRDYEASEVECQTLLEGDPDSELRESTLRLLVLIAFQRQRYRSASGLLIELSDLIDDAAERNRIQLLVADCFFQAGDYGDAAQSYGIAIQQEETEIDRGTILFQWVLSDIKSGNLESAAKHMEIYKKDPAIDPVQKWKSFWNLITALQTNKDEIEAYDLLNDWLTQDAREVLPVSLWLRLLWFRCQLSLKTSNFESTPVLAGQVYTVLREAEGTIDPVLGIRVASLTQVLEAQSLIFSGRQDEGLELIESVRRDFPSTRAAVQSYLIEARYDASQNRMVDAQRRYTELFDNYPTSELAPVALYEAAIHALRRGTDSTLKEANAILQRLAESFPNHPLVFYGRLNQGNLLRDFNDFGGAEVVFERLLITFPNHKDRAIVEMAQAECILAQTDTSQARISQALGKFERLAELPDLPIDLRVEASYKWAFSYGKRDNQERVIQIYWLAVNQFLIDDDQSSKLGSTGRYWMSRIIISLGEALEELGDVETARRVYSYIPDRGLPFNNLAEGKLSRLAQKKG